MSDEKAIFAEALAIASPDQRRAFLDGACGCDATLRAQVEDLLAAHERAGSFLESPPSGAALATAPGGSADLAGTTIGHYKLLEQIGEGGMGVVYMAEQARPVRRTVAIKIIKPGLDSKQVIARFEAERQALALMDHPNIARVFDAGTTESGRPYFVMELVRGIPITEYCDQHQLTPRKRLELFIPVCQAVQHAHQKGIIHRDLKPTNVLITLQDGDKPTPKVIDFGIAKATAGQRLTDLTLFTEFKQLIGTPLYMSPEQAEMSAVMDVDTRSDVYSLGVLLYELLTGTTPFDKERLGKAAFDEVRRIIREEEPPRPSTRLSTMGEVLTTVSASRATDPKRLSQTIRGELDWIVMKALEKDRTRRYETATGLAHDIERYLSDQPVEACPPSQVYRVRKFIRRNKAVLGTAVVIATVLIAATAVSTWEAIRARRADRLTLRERDEAVSQQHRADEEAAVAKAVNDFFNKDVLAQASPSNQLGKDTTPDSNLTVRDALHQSIKGLDGRFRNQPLVEAAIRHSIGDALGDLFEFKEAERQLQIALRIRQQVLGDADPDTLETLGTLGLVYRGAGQPDQAEPLLSKMYRVSRERRGERDPMTLKAAFYVAVLAAWKNDHVKAEAMLRPLLETERTVLGNRHPDTLDTIGALGQQYFELGEYGKAEKLLTEALHGSSEVRGNSNPDTVWWAIGLSLVYREQQRYAEAEPILLEALEATRQTFGDANAKTIDLLKRLAELYEAEGKTDQAATIQQQVLAQRKTTLGAHDPATLVTMSQLARLHIDRGEYAKAEPLLTQALNELRNTRGNDSNDTMEAEDSLGLLYFREKRFDDAEPLWLASIRSSQKVLGPEHPDTLTKVSNLALLYGEQHKYDRAEPLFLQALAGKRKVLGELDDHTVGTRMGLASMYADMHRFEDADRLYQEQLKLMRTGGHPDDPNIAAFLFHFAQLKKREGKLSEADNFLQQSLAIRRKAFGNNNADVAMTLADLGVVLRMQKRYADAEQVFREALAVRQVILPDGDWVTSNCKRALAATLVSQRKFEEAERLLLQANEEFKSNPPPPEQAARVRDALALTVRLYEQWGKPEQAALWRAKLNAATPASRPATSPAKNSPPHP